VVDDDGHVELSADIAVGFIMLVMLDRPACRAVDGIGAGVFGLVLKIVNEFEEAGANAEEACEQQDGSPSSHEDILQLRSEKYKDFRRRNCKKVAFAIWGNRVGRGPGMSQRILPGGVDLCDFVSRDSRDAPGFQRASGRPVHSALVAGIQGDSTVPGTEYRINPDSF